MPQALTEHNQWTAPYDYRPALASPPCPSPPLRHSRCTPSPRARSLPSQARSACARPTHAHSSLPSLPFLPPGHGPCTTGLRARLPSSALARSLPARTWRGQHAFRLSNLNAQPRSDAQHLPRQRPAAPSCELGTADPDGESIANLSNSDTAGLALWPSRPARGPLRSSHESQS
jgi:hypothetical protein